MLVKGIIKSPSQKQVGTCKTKGECGIIAYMDINYTPLDAQKIIRMHYSAMGKKGGKTAGAINKAKGSEYFSKISRKYWDSKKEGK